MSGNDRQDYLTDDTVTLPDDRVAVSSRVDYFYGRTITLTEIASSPGSTVHVPGIGRAPAAGTSVVSPAMAALIDAVPADQLGNRYGTRAGLIGNAALAGPDSLVIVSGRTVPQLVTDNAPIVAGFAGSDYANESYRTVAIIGGIAVLLPVLLLVGIVTELGAAARIERFSTLRLIGATPRTVARIAAFEIGISSAIGSVVGMLASWLITPLTAQITMEGSRFFAADLRVDPLTTVVIVVGTVVATTAVAGYRALRADVGPLGVTKTRQERPPRIIGLLPLAAGVGMMVVATLAALAERSLPYTGLILIAGFVLTSLGLLAAGPLVTFWASRFAARRASSAVGLIAMNRIRLHPRATFRSVSGLVIAVFMVSVFAAAMTTAAEETTRVADGDHLPLSSLVAHLAATPEMTAESLVEQKRALEQVPGVEAVAIGFLTADMDDLVFSPADLAGLGLGRVAGPYASVNGGYLGNETAQVRSVDIAAPATLTPTVLLISTDGSPAALERARTAVTVGPADLYVTPTTRAENSGSNSLEMASEYSNLANLGILVATLISAISLTISTTASILDRKRVLGLLRITGMPQQALRRVLVAETALPLVTVFVACIGLGFLVAWTILAGLTEGRRTVSWPDPSYYVVLGVSLLLALVAVLGTFRTARRSTGLVATRFE